MLKLQSLRALIERVVPDLARDPERLIVMASNGQAVCTGTVSLSFEYQYTATITVLDYTGHTDALIVPLLAWIKVNQPELLDNPQLRDKALRFSVEHLNTNAVDIGIEIDITERAIVRPGIDHPTRLTITHPDEPSQAGLVYLAEHWELWLRDEAKLAEWDLYPPPAKALFGL